MDELSQNRLQLEAHDAAGPAFARMEEILAAERPYNLLHEVADLIHIARSANDELVAGESAWEQFEDPFEPWPLTDDQEVAADFGGDA